MLTFLMFGILTLGVTNAIIGYDCGHESTNITTISLLHVEECDIPESKVQVTSKYIQLLQLNEFESVRVIQCKVEIDRLIKKCGMFSHTMDVSNGKYAYIQEVTKGACEELHKYGQIKIGNTLIQGLKTNQSATRPITFAGSIDNEGECNGAAYTDPYGSWVNVIVTGYVKITLQESWVKVNLNTNKIHLRSGVVCDFSNTQCVDIEGGDTFWSPLPPDPCDSNKYGVLYEGMAEKVIDHLDNLKQTVFSITTEDIIFALTSKQTYSICGYTLIKTEHPKLVIFETIQGERFVQKKRIDVNNLDIFTYINSKFVYVEKHIRTQMKQLYKDILTQQCNIERQMITNGLTIATQAPDIFAYHLMKGPGHMAVVAGEVVHIIKCIPVEVTIAKTNYCYNYLPVMRNNDTYFLTPQTHILLKQGMQTGCSTFVPPMYLLENAWYKLMPSPIESLPPIILKPQTKTVWKYKNPGSLATAGIYSEKDIKELRDHIMFPVEKPAVLNTIALGVLGQPTEIRGGSIANLFDEAAFEKLTENTWKKIWGKFTVFGNISAGIIGIFMIIRAIKLIIDTIIHGYALHTVYGWSLYLIGAIWDSVTHLFLHLARRTNPAYSQRLRNEPETIELLPVSQNIPTAPSVALSGNHEVETLDNNPIEGEINSPRTYPRLFDIGKEGLNNAV